MVNPVVLALKETLKKKILKQQQKEFKQVVQSFLQNPSTNYQKIHVKPFHKEEIVKKTKTVLLT